MRVIRSISLGLLAILVLFLALLNAQSAGSKSADLERSIHDCEGLVDGWRTSEYVEIAFLITAFALATVISALQASTSTKVKHVTVTLGIVTAVLTAVNGILFPADVKTLRRAVIDGSSVIDQLRIKAGFLENDQLSAGDRRAATDDFAATVRQCYAVADKVVGSSPPAMAMPSVLTAVYAQSSANLPAWARQKPPDTATASFFVGKASDASLAIAKANSADAALYSAAVTLLASSPNVSRSALLDLIKSSSLSQDSAFTYDKKAQMYEYYTLLRLAPEIQNLVKTLPPTVTAVPVVFQAHGWQPADLTSNAASGLFALDTAGGVSSLVTDTQGTHIQKLFQLRRTDSGYAIAATKDAVLVASNSSLGCTAYRYSLATKATVSRILAVHERCVGIATDGTALYVSMPGRREVRYWESWDAPSYHSWSAGDTGEPGFLAFDSAENRLVVADSSGRAYAISVADGKKQLLHDDLGSVQSIAASRFHILIASGRKVLFLARSDNHGENPPVGWPGLPGGNVVGLAVDNADNLWIADYDNKLVKGPFTLI